MFELVYLGGMREDDRWHNEERDFKCFKLFRVLRLGTDFVPDGMIMGLVQKMNGD